MRRLSGDSIPIDNHTKSVPKGGQARSATPARGIETTLTTWYALVRVIVFLCPISPLRVESDTYLGVHQTRGSPVRADFNAYRRKFMDSGHRR